MDQKISIINIQDLGLLVASRHYELFYKNISILESSSIFRKFSRYWWAADTLNESP
jgi:hypothetical protein